MHGKSILIAAAGFTAATMLLDFGARAAGLPPMGVDAGIVRPAKHPAQETGVEGQNGTRWLQGTRGIQIRRCVAWSVHGKRCLAWR